MMSVMQDIFALARRSRQAGDPSRERKRYSVDKSDLEAYKNYLKALADNKKINVYVDGIRVEKAVSADEVTGVVVAYKLPIQIVGDDLVTITMRGAVLVELEETS